VSRPNHPKVFAIGREQSHDLESFRHRDDRGVDEAE